MVVRGSRGYHTNDRNGDFGRVLTAAYYDVIMALFSCSLYYDDKNATFPVFIAPAFRRKTRAVTGRHFWYFLVYWFSVHLF